MLLYMMSGILIVLCCSAAVFDLRYRRIPNWLVLLAFSSGLLARGFLGLDAVLSGLLAAALAFVFGLLFYLLGGLGAGDVKLMGGLAAFLGLEGLLTGLAVMAAVGVLMALFGIWRAGVVRRTFRNLFLFFLTLGKDSFRGFRGEGVMATLSTDGAPPVRSPFGVAVAAGAIAGWFAPLSGWAL